MDNSEFSRFVIEYLDDLHSRRPSFAASSGIHTWDATLEDFGSAAIADEITAIKRFKMRLERIPRIGLSLSDSFDYQLVASNMKARLLELEKIKNYERNPQIYSDAISNGLLLISMFEYASADVRLRSIVEKEKQVPRLVASAKSNIKDPPPIYLKNSLSSFRGTLDFIEKDLPRAFAGIGDAKLREDFKKSTQRAADAIYKYIEHLEKVKPRPGTPFALGKENYEAKLRYEEGIDIPVEVLLVIARRELAKTQEQFRKTAARIDPNRDPMRVWAEVQADHPKAGTLVEEARKQLDALVKFIEDRNIITLPEGAGPIVGSTPDFMKWATASMWAAGPLETRDLPSRYLITDVDSKWTDQQKEEYLASLNYAQLWTTSIHEAYPGHYVQSARLRRVQSVVRRTWALAPASFVEGWAHYTEQMMIDEGFGGADPKMRLGQLADALLRLCRFVVGIEEHTGSMSVDQATRFFIENAYMGEVPSRIEAERGTFDPTYSVYSIGKLAIMKLRDDCRRDQRNRFSLREFHDRLLATGLAPLWVHRQVLLPGDNGKLIE